MCCEFQAMQSSVTRPCLKNSKLKVEQLAIDRAGADWAKHKKLCGSELWNTLPNHSMPASKKQVYLLDKKITSVWSEPSWAVLLVTCSPYMGLIVFPASAFSHWHFSLPTVHFAPQPQIKTLSYRNFYIYTNLLFPCVMRIPPLKRLQQCLLSRTKQQPRV